MTHLSGNTAEILKDLIASFSGCTITVDEHNDPVVEKDSDFDDDERDTIYRIAKGHGMFTLDNSMDNKRRVVFVKK